VLIGGEMISLLSMAVSAVTSAFIYALKAFFSLVTWFFRTFIKLFKLLFVVLPITSALFVILFCVNVFLLLGNAGKFASLSELDIPGDVLDEEKVKTDALSMINNGTVVTKKLFSELFSWWIKNIYSYHGTSSYVLLLILTILMFLPVVSIFICITVPASYGQLLFFAVVADAALYLMRSLLGKSPLKQALSRYFRLFPDAGRRHYEKNYDRFLRNRDKEIEEKQRAARRGRASDFYEDDRYSDENYEDDEYDADYEEEYYEDEDYPEDEYYEDEGYLEDDGYYEDEEYLEEDDPDDEYYEDDFEDDYDTPRNRRFKDKKSQKKTPQSSTSETFNFFAGCTSKESVDKKYKSLVKLYHPDNMDGDTAALQEINAQYAEAKKRFL